MALNDGDKIELTLDGRFLTNQVVNVFQYEYEGTSLPEEISYQEMTDAFLVEVVQKLQPIMSTYMSWQKITVRNLSNGLGIYEVPVLATGASGGDPTSSFVALGVTLYRTTAITRNGSKRFAGLPEDAVSGNLLQVGSTALNALMQGLTNSLILVDGNSATIGQFNPVIIGRDAITKQYDLSRVNLVRAVGNPTVTTQVSRKQGRGN